MIASHFGHSTWDLAFQSRSGPPTQPWLEPDILDWLSAFRGQGGESVVIVPLGFVSDHLEVLYDLDVEAKELASELGLKMVRAQTAGTHPEFVRMIRDLILERVKPEQHAPQAVGLSGPWPNLCPATCCPSPRSGARTGRPAG